MANTLLGNLRGLDQRPSPVQDQPAPPLPGPHTYGLTGRGRDLDAALQALEGVAERWQAAGDQPAAGP